jgi:Polyketide cyclase / dehydrase and lipid transport
MKQRTTMLTYFVAALAIVIVVFVVMASRQPDTFRVERSVTMAAPASSPFAQVNDFHNWKLWSPYEGLDPNMKQTCSETAGVDSTMSWSGNRKAGEGNMTIVESHPNDVVRIRLQFTRPFAATNTAEFTFKPEGNQTVVTWAMTGKNPYMFKALHTVINMDKLVGRDFERGLASMKTVVENQQRLS